MNDPIFKSLETFRVLVSFAGPHPCCTAYVSAHSKLGARMKTYARFDGSRDLKAVGVDVLGRVPEPADF